MKWDKRYGLPTQRDVFFIIVGLLPTGTFSMRKTFHGMSNFSIRETTKSYNHIFGRKYFLFSWSVEVKLISCWKARDSPAVLFKFWTIQGVWVFITLLPTLILNTERRDPPLARQDYIGASGYRLLGSKQDCLLISPILYHNTYRTIYFR